ncbi:MAG: hypothetical protein RR279_01000 [Alistipes sp.]
MRQNFKRYIPLVAMTNGMTLFYHYGRLYIYDPSQETMQGGGRFPFSLKDNILARLSIISRCMRLETRYAMQINDSEILILKSGYFFTFNIITHQLTKKNKLLRGSRPLNMARIEGIEGFTDGIYYGEYFGNPTKESVRIKQFSKDLTEETTCYSFAEGMINHIHNVVPDKFHQCVWIFTGDFGGGAGIWKATNNFKTVEAIGVGEQKYRACVVFPIKEGLLYATDSPFEKNSIRILKQIDGEWISEPILEINGSSIYGGVFNDQFIFSTAVESDGIYTSKFNLLFDRKKGLAITDYYSYVYMGNLESGFNIIYKVKKDKLPFFLFQFGVTIFPTGHITGNYLPIYHIGTTDHDLSTKMLKLY